MNCFATRTLCATLLLAASVLTGCDDATDPQSCTLEDYPSVSIDVRDAAGDRVLLPPGSVTYTVDDGNPQTLDAEFDTLDNPVMIYGSSGEFEVTVAPAGYEPGVVTAQVEPTDDGCHVVTQERELVLEDLGDDGTQE